MMNVTLLDGIFQQSQETGKRYLLHLDVDRLVAPCYEAAGVAAKKPRYGGWEATQIAGHSIGHWLSAAATMIDATGDEALKRQLRYAVDELAEAQSHDPDGYVSGFARDCFDRVFDGDGEFEVHNFGLGGSWVPWYSIHKIYAGLIDAYRLAGIEKALEVVVKLADWAKKGTDKLTDEQFQRMLICEHGGMNEAMADLYLLTGNQAYLNLAVRFCHEAILEPLARGIDELEGKHANTQIPKVIGAAKLYEITGDEKYRRMAEFFWQEVTGSRSYVIGGNSIFEHFRARGSEKLGVETAETCNTYNMLKLTGHLFRWSPNAAYMDYYERALYNHILASQDPDSGMKMYFVSTEPGHFKVYGTPDQSFWCCTGTGMENPARYNAEIYHAAEDGIYVNLFIGSVAAFEDRGVVLRQETDFPTTDRTRIRIDSGSGESWKLRVRVPYWAAGEVTAAVNGVLVAAHAEQGYLEIDRVWQAGDYVDVTLPMGLHLYRAKDDDRKVSFLYGPVVLAGALGREHYPENDILDVHTKLHHHQPIDVPTLVTDEQEIGRWIRPVDGKPLTFVTEAVGQPGHASVELIPFYALHHQRYTIYWRWLSEAEYGGYIDLEQAERERLAAITVDAVSPHEQQSEVEHGIRSQGSSSGYSVHAQRGYRDAIGEDGYFGYRMAVLPDRPTALQVAYFGSERELWRDGVRYERDFTVLVDGIEIARQQLSGEKPDQLIEVLYEIPGHLTYGKSEVDVTFAASAGKVAGGVYGVRTVDRERLEELDRQD